ncbi:MAG TPA: cell envelope biogenesis protein OmpA [Syntrophales bacterium]|nr:cell envelope biogenesis protein OmpA [Syntrophobacterales bacterium]HRR39770.1 cell envelope biogenesis protein OmpA [Syntrophales bacterium]HRT26938.1 cell envelope biogenesis protein OmpA [Syntrophales bacterium]
MKRISLILVVFFLAGCAGQRPVLYPNNHLQQVGEERAQRDISECMQKAEAYVKANPGAEIIGGAAGGGIMGTIAGSAAGAVDNDLGRGAAIGAASGAAVGLVRGIVKASQPSPVFKAFVNRCLKEKGYEPLGWE